MQLTIRQLNLILADNEKQLKAELLTNNTSRIVELTSHRAIVKDCLIEALTNKLKTVTYKNEVLNAIIDSKC